MPATWFELILKCHKKKSFFIPYLLRFFIHKLTQNAYLLHFYELYFTENGLLKREKIWNNRYFLKKPLISPTFFIKSIFLLYQIFSLGLHWNAVQQVSIFGVNNWKYTPKTALESKLTTCSLAPTCDYR